MRPWLKQTLWISATFIVVWTAAIVFWLNTSRVPAQSDLLLSLAGLPLLLIGVGWGAYTLATHRDVRLSLQQIESGRAPDDDAIPVLKLILLSPERWSGAHESAASEWAKTLVVQHGWPDRSVLVADNSQTQASPVELLDQICVMGGKTKLSTIGLMLACDSGIDQSEVDVLISRGQLSGGKNPAGSKPSEVVAALLVADEKQSRLFSEKELSKLHRASWGFREKSADERGKISAALLGSVVLQAVQSSGTTVESIQFVSSDNDHKSSREAKLAQMFFAKLTDFDCLKDTVVVAQTFGSSRRALTSAAVCRAHQYVITEEMPAVCVSLQALLLRAAVVLTAAEIEDDALAPAG